MSAACASMLVATAVAAAEPPPSEPPAREKVEILRTRDDVGIECWSPGSCARKGSRDLEPPPKPLGPPLTRDEIAPEMRKVEPEVRACGQAVDATGSVSVRIVIHRDGHIALARVMGRLAGTPLAACVEKPLKSIRFRGNEGLWLDYPFFFKTSASAADCSVAAGAGKKVNAAALQQLGAPLGRCGSGGTAVKVPVRFATDEKRVIRGAEAQYPQVGTREGFCVERALACLVGSVADGLPARWEIGLDGSARAPATLRSLP